MFMNHFFNIEFCLNLVVHLIFIISALLISFVLIIAPIEQRSLESIFKNNIRDLFETQMDKLTHDKKTQLRPLFHAVAPVIKPRTIDSDSIKQNNYKLIYIVICVLVFLITFSVTTAFRKWVNGDDITFLINILLENFLIFMCVGAIDIAFFLLIASKYIPLKMSVFESNLIDHLKKEFKN
jgi:hypothetical protein